MVGSRRGVVDCSVRWLNLRGSPGQARGSDWTRGATISRLSPPKIRDSEALIGLLINNIKPYLHISINETQNKVIGIR